MDGYQYEYGCAKYLEDSGFTNITVTPKSGDQGIDIIATKAGKKFGIQCKYYTGSVGNKAVQEAYAGAAFYSCDVAVVITNATFSKSAITLAQKLGVELWAEISAITFYANTKNLSEKLSIEEKEQLEVERLEKMLQKKYQILYSKYPENDAKDAEISQYVQRNQKHITNLLTNFKKNSDSIYSNMCFTTFHSTRDPVFIQYKNRLKNTCMHYSETFVQLLEKVDKEATYYLSSGISEKSVKLLISLIKKIRYEGDIETVLNEKVIAKTRWSAKHERIIRKWDDLRNQLPSILKYKQKEEEERESRYAHENLNIHRQKIEDIKDDIATLQANISERTNRITTLNTQLKNIENAKEVCLSEIANTKLHMSEELSPIQYELSSTEAELSAVTEQIQETRLTLGQQSLFAFRIKKELNIQLTNLQKHQIILGNKHEEIIHRIDTLQSQYQISLDKLMNKREKMIDKQTELQEELDDIKTEIADRSVEKQIEKKQAELTSLQNMLPTFAEQIRNVHINYLKKILQM